MTPIDVDERGAKKELNETAERLEREAAESIGRDLHTPMRFLPVPGIYYDVPFTDYLQWDCLSQSTLKEGRESMAHLAAAIAHERVKEVTDDMALGTALHCAFLEPELMPLHVVRWDGGRRYGGKWDEFCDEHADKTILTPDRYELLVGMVRSMRRHPFVREWWAKTEAVEVSAVGEIEGVLMKGRTDALTPEPLVDLKKVRSTHPAAIMRTVLTFGYHIQAHIYQQLFDRGRFVLLCVEDKPPYDVVPFELSPAMLRIGRDEATDLLAKYKQCKASGAWPGRSDKIVTLEAPEWLGRGDGITLGDDSAFDEE